MDYCYRKIVITIINVIYKLKGCVLFINYLEQDKEYINITGPGNTLKLLVSVVNI